MKNTTDESNKGNKSNFKKNKFNNNININFSNKYWTLNKNKMKKNNISGSSKILLVKTEKINQIKEYNWGDSLKFLMKNQPSYSFNKLKAIPSKKNNIPTISKFSKKKVKINREVEEDKLINQLNNIKKEKFLQKIKKKKIKNENEEEFILYSKLNNNLNFLSGKLENIKKLINSN